MRHITTAGAALLRKFTTTRGRRQTPTRRRAGIPLGVEGLEERSLLAASASLLNNGALLEVKGTDGRDTIRVSRTGNEVKVDFNGAAPSKTFSAAKLTLIKVFGYKENDYISTYGVNVNASLVGGDGHDSLYGGLGKDSLYGSEGNDLIYGNEGDDDLQGWTGNDSLYGYTGNDLLYGGEGNDFLKGNDGSDTLYGWTGTDTLIGDAGLDRLDGGAGNDRLEVFLDLDALIANKGRTINFSDSYKAGNGTDTIQVTLDLDSFGRRYLKPIVNEVSAATHVVQPVLDLLDRKIPFLSQLDKNLTFGSLLSRANANVGKFITTVRTVREFKDSVGTWSGTVDLGTFTIASGSMDVRTVTSNAIGGITSTLLTKLRNVGFSFTMLEDPRSVVKMMLGQGAKLFELKLPTLDVSYNYSKKWDIPTGIAGVFVQTTLGGSMRVRAGATLGLDTAGIWTGKLLDGFYVSNAFASLTAGLSASGAVAIGIPNVWSAVSAGIEGGVSGTLTFTLKDPNGDGKVTWNELPQYYSDAFKTSGQLNYGVSGFVKYWHITKFKNVKESWSFYTGTLRL